MLGKISSFGGIYGSQWKCLKENTGSKIIRILKKKLLNVLLKIKNFPINKFSKSVIDKVFIYLFFYSFFFLGGNVDNNFEIGQTNGILRTKQILVMI